MMGDVSHNERMRRPEGGAAHPERRGTAGVPCSCIIRLVSLTARTPAMWRTASIRRLPPTSRLLRSAGRRRIRCSLTAGGPCSGCSYRHHLLVSWTPVDVRSPWLGTWMWTLSPPAYYAARHPEAERTAVHRRCGTVAVGAHMRACPASNVLVHSLQPRHHIKSSTMAICSPIHLMTGTAIELPMALYLGVSGVPPRSVHPSGKPCKRSHSIGVRRRTA